MSTPQINLNSVQIAKNNQRMHLFQAGVSTRITDECLRHLDVLESRFQYEVNHQGCQSDNIPVETELHTASALPHVLVNAVWTVAVEEAWHVTQVFADSEDGTLTVTFAPAPIQTVEVDE